MPLVSTPTPYGENEHMDDCDQATPVVISGNNNLEIFNKLSVLLDSTLVDGTNNAQQSSENSQGGLSHSSLATPQQLQPPLDLSFLIGLNPELYQNITQNLGAYNSFPSGGAPFHQPSQSLVVGGQRGHSQMTADSFIPGAISNRTLEHLTECSFRACRPIRGDQKLFGGCSAPSADHSNGFGIIGDRGGMAQQTTSGGFGLDLLGVARSNSPSDSDTSGVSSGSEFSETALLELMVSSNIRGLV